MVPGLGSQGVVAKGPSGPGGTGWAGKLGSFGPLWEGALGPGLLMSWGSERALGGAQPAWSCSQALPASETSGVSHPEAVRSLLSSRSGLGGPGGGWQSAWASQSWEKHLGEGKAQV